MTERHDYLRREIREWLRSESADRLANGGDGDPSSREHEYCRVLGLRWQTGLVSGPITARSQQPLKRLIADPDQPVCDLAGHDEDDPDPCDGQLGHVFDSWAVAAPTVLASKVWHELPAEHHARFRGPHAHGRITIYRDHGGAQYAIWTDGDPTKGAAWNITEDVALDEARSILQA